MGRCGGAPKAIEEQVAELVAAILVPMAAARQAAITGRAPASLAGQCRVSLEMARRRMQISGGYKIAERARAERTTSTR